MKFLSVFCVVLYLHTGVTTINENNGQNNPCEQSKNIKFQTNDGALHNQFNSIDSPSSLNAQQTKANEDSGGEFTKKISNDPIIPSEEITSGPDLSLKSTENKETDRIDLSVQNQTDTLLSRTLLRDLAKGHNSNLQNEVLVNRSYQPNKETSGSDLPKGCIQNTILPNTYNEPKYINSAKNVTNTHQNQPKLNKVPLKSGERVRLDAEGISLEKIKSLIRMSALGNSSEQQLPPITNSNLHKDSYQSLRYIINKAKKIHDIHSSAKKLKRYMVVHPDGTVEHIDKIDKVAKRYPNYIAIKSVDLSKYVTHIPDSPTFSEQKCNKEMNLKSPNYVNFDELNKNKVSDQSSFAKANSSSEVFVNSTNKKENQLNIHKNKLPGTVNVNKTLQNITTTPLLKHSTETVPKEDSRNTIPIQKTPLTPVNPELENIITVPPNSEVILKVKNSNNVQSSFRLLPLNVHQHNKDSSSSPGPCLEDIDDTQFWFRDKNFWDKLGTDSHNIFFMFIPTSPLLKKQTKTTTYVNGTTVEEIINIVDEEDGIPVATKTTKITHAAEASLEAKET